ncbi:4Fe-4S dicluster domain-containing protein [Thermosediminibacter litoriperuensis]|uniref:2-oxoglutarate ferredoxin oxidoreductase subunit delta n=1 Tax=Thermosediminibacter litoriperuensis TaxID=291989 RepID=A0A5S5ARK2_9FIRM|nr:4Fe-4S binding protein [Thermosediminibacter litoriperuensis]TYP54324.1 2-oxoglutarate ferredoxin oxidoreductase subunit delta [Thermosediminibacter litoriperuensis]
MSEKNFEIKINEKACKRCGICIAFCPKKVFSSENDKPVVVNPDACTKCKLCEIRCPDFAIVVGGDDDDDK